MEPLSIAVHCCKLAGDVQGKCVVIFGAGPIGLLCSAVIRAFGAASVVVVDVVASRLAFAMKYGASKTYQMGSMSPEINAGNLLAGSGKVDGADIIIEATGAEPCINSGVAALRRGGVFVQAGLGAPRVGFPIGQICDKEATLKGSFRYGAGDYKLAIELLQSRRVLVQDLITHEFAFDDAEKAFVSVSQRVGIKTIIYGPGIDARLLDQSVKEFIGPVQSKI